MQHLLHHFWFYLRVTHTAATIISTHTLRAELKAGGGAGIISQALICHWRRKSFLGDLLCSLPLPSQKPAYDHVPSTCLQERLSNFGPDVILYL